MHLRKSRELEVSWLGIVPWFPSSPSRLCSLPLDVPLKPMNPRRKPCEHTLIAKGHANDDEVIHAAKLNTRASFAARAG